jgi:diphthamide synthase subunit DPH2
MKTIVLCSSANFYKHANEIKAELEKMGYRAVVPTTAEKMAETGDYNPEHYKTWYDNVDDMPFKQERMRGHFDKVHAGDAVLVVNDTKHGIDGYIGPNVLMEMALAFFEKKPIYVMNPVSDKVNCWEEVLGMGSIFINGDLSQIKM